MRKTIPRLVYSVLGRRVYIVLRYTLKGTTDDRRVQMVAHEKYDVTDDFTRVIGEWRKDGNTIDQLAPKKRPRKSVLYPTRRGVWR